MNNQTCPDCGTHHEDCDLSGEHFPDSGCEPSCGVHLYADGGCPTCTGNPMTRERLEELEGNFGCNECGGIGGHELEELFAALREYMNREEKLKERVQKMYDAGAHTQLEWKMEIERILKVKP